MIGRRTRAYGRPNPRPEPPADTRNPTPETRNPKPEISGGDTAHYTPNKGVQSIAEPLIEWVQSVELATRNPDRNPQPGPDTQIPKYQEAIPRIGRRTRGCSLLPRPSSSTSAASYTPARFLSLEAFDKTRDPKPSNPKLESLKRF